jgi:uncharacterized membrane protein YdjX (TVP38/TMEM64 family)
VGVLPAARGWRLAAAVAVAVAALATTAAVGVDADRIQGWLTESGPWGPAAFVLSMWLLQPVGIPGVVWMIPAGVIWSWPVAAALSWVGNMGASSLGFGFARWAGRAWVAERLPPRLRAVDSRLGERGVGPVVALRVVTGQLAPAEWVLGVSSLRWRTFLVGTAIGIVPGILMAVVAGGGLVQWGLRQGPLVWSLGVVGAAGAVAVLWVVRRRLDTSAPPTGA